MKSDGAVSFMMSRKPIALITKETGEEGGFD